MEVHRYSARLGNTRPCVVQEDTPRFVAREMDKARGFPTGVLGAEHEMKHFDSVNVMWRGRTRK